MFNVYVYVYVFTYIHIHSDKKNLSVIRIIIKRYYKIDDRTICA